MEVKLDRTGKIIQNERLAGNIYKMRLSTGECEFTRPGQFAIIEADGKRRPFQVCDYDSNRFTVVYRADDETGIALSQQPKGTVIKAQTGLGNGYNVEDIPDGAVLAADDIGIPEMLGLARALLMQGKNCKLVLGYGSREDIYMINAFRNLVNEIEVLTADGSNGREGIPANAIRRGDYVCASGSADMLKGLAKKTGEGQFSLNVPVLIYSDDYDDCMIETVDGACNCCDAGPIFDKNMILWDNLKANSIEIKPEDN